VTAIYTEFVSYSVGYEFLYPLRCGGNQWAEQL